MIQNELEALIGQLRRAVEILKAVKEASEWEERELELSMSALQHVASHHGPHDRLTTHQVRGLATVLHEIRDAASAAGALSESAELLIGTTIDLLHTLTPERP
jgi:hypothetical protein